MTSLFFVVLLLCPDHSATMNDLDNFGFGNIGPDTLETENQQEEEPEQESNTSTQQNTAATNDPDDFGFGDVSPQHIGSRTSTRTRTRTEYKHATKYYCNPS